MNRIAKLIVLICFLPVLGFGQTLRISYEPGYGLYSMANLKNIQQNMIRNSDLPIMSVEEFPGYINHSVSVDYYLDNNILFGINAAYLTTGGRSHLRDYSGEYKLDMILNAYQYGIESEYNFILNNRLCLFTNFKIGVISSKLNVSETITLYDVDSQTTSDIVSQFDFFMEPNAGLSYNITKRISARVAVGLNINTSLINEKLMDWTGLRTRIGFSYFF